MAKIGAKPPARRRSTPTLKTIAQLTGLAVPTVSRALSDAPDIGEATKVLVRNTARSVGYIPNRAGVRLRTGKTNVISLVLTTRQDMMNYTARLISSIAEGLRATPYHLIITPYFADEDPLRPVRYIVETHSADALILNQIQPRDARVRYLMEQRFPFATHGRTEWCARHPYYDFDNTRYGEAGAAALLARGRRKLLVIAPPRTQAYAGHMIEGATRTMVAGGGCVAVLDGATSDNTGDEIEPAVAAHLAAHPGTDAILCASNTAAMAAVTALEGLGRRLGDDIDLFSKEPTPFLRRFRSNVLTVQEDVGRAGAFLAQAAMAAIEDPDAPPMQAMQTLDETSGTPTCPPTSA